jgi:uncharacterized cupredoxin-like copper-binding protein
VLLLALSTSHKVGLGVVGVLFVLFALASSFLLPRFRPEFPGRGLPLFLIVTGVLFAGMLTAVFVFGKEPKEAAAAKEETSTSAATTPATTSAGTARVVDVTEVDYKIKLQASKLSPATYTFVLKNKGKDVHNLTIKGPNVPSAATPTIAGGKTAKVSAGLEPGTSELYCSVPGHKQAGMDLKIKVS